VDSFFLTGKPAVLCAGGLIYIQLVGCMWDVDCRGKNGGVFAANMSACGTGEGEGFIFIVQLELQRRDSCRISFDMYGSIISGGAQVREVENSAWKGFFGYQSLQNLKFQTLVPSFPPLPSPTNHRPNLLYLRER
jgi:hypothetical protein